MGQLQVSNRDFQSIHTARRSFGSILCILGPGAGGGLVGRDCVTPTPTYGRFVNAIEAHGAALVRVPVNDKLEQDLNAMTAAIR